MTCPGLSDDGALTVVDERDIDLAHHRVHRVVKEPSLASDLQAPLAELLDQATHR